MEENHSREEWVMDERRKLKLLAADIALGVLGRADAAAVSVQDVDVLMGMVTRFVKKLQMLNAEVPDGE